MPEFLELIPPSEALSLILSHINYRLQPESISADSSLDRVTWGSIHAPHALPSFNRSTVDGFAIRAQDTYGASESLPSYLNVIGEVKMGSAPAFDLSPASCALIHTGGMLPASANAVIMLEHTQSISSDEIEVLRAVADGENVLHTGEDVSHGQIVIPDGKRLGPAEVGGLAALGINQIQVCRKPRVAIISSGDEVVPADAQIRPGEVRDVNTHTLSSLISRYGGTPVSFGIQPDRLDVLIRTAQDAIENCDTVVFTAGSSASARDLTSEAINGLGKPGVLVHGINVRPGKPTILAACKPELCPYPKPVIGLPGNPVSAMVIALLFVKPIIQRLMGLPADIIQDFVTARLTINLSSQAGREDWVPVKLFGSHPDWQAEPVFGKSNLIFTLVRSDGLLRIPPDATGLNAGSLVDVFLL
jgi:molybdopterin molybdotransferase